VVGCGGLRWAAWLCGAAAVQAIALRGNPCMAKNAKKARVTLLGHVKSLRQHHCSLRVIDTPISVDERVAAWLSRGEREARGLPCEPRTLLPFDGPDRTEPASAPL
jgi:hypothetical protein